MGSSVVIYYNYNNKKLFFFLYIAYCNNLSKRTIMKYKIVFTLILLSISLNANAQFVDDAVRFINSNAFKSIRAAALGEAYFGFSDDGSALLSNPAGITLIPVSEFSMGMNLTSHNTITNFLGNNKKEINNEFYFTNVNFIFPTFVNNDFYNYNNYENENEDKGFNFKFGFDYHISNDFCKSTNYGGFNPYNTFIAQQASKKQEWVKVAGLVDEYYQTDIRNNMYQDGFIVEDGGLHNLSFGFGMDLDQIFSLGATITMKFGTYKYNRKYFENDKDNNYYIIPFNVDRISVVEKLTQELFGVTGIIGCQARLSRYCRFGVAVTFPTLLIDSEYFAANYHTLFDNNNTSRYSTGSMYNVYNIVTPFEFTAGLSGNIKGLSYSVSATTLNAANTYFKGKELFELNYDDLLFFDDLNDLIEQALTRQYKMGVGLEYKIPNAPLYLRGSYSLQTSPYKDKTICNNNNIIGAGVGLVLTNNLIIDASLVYSSQDYRMTNYGSDAVPHLASFYNVKYTPMSYLLGFRYRFY